MIHHKQVLVLNISCSLIGHTDNAGSWFEPSLQHIKEGSSCSFAKS